MEKFSNLTFICGVLYYDIVGYSKRISSVQLSLKERLNSAVTESILGVPANDRITLDTVGGAALVFLGDPEDALFVCLRVRDALAAQAMTAQPRLQIRSGINLGPVKLVKDINGHPGVIGDGYNTARSIMRFADPGQILASRSYYDVIARLSESYAKLFQHQGAKTDEYIREHEVYAVAAAPSRVLRHQDTTTDKAGGSPGPERKWTAAVAAHLRNLLR